MRALFAPIVLALLVAACGGPNQTGGTLVGAGLGALAGNQFGHGSGRVAATAGGAVLGGLIGGGIGANADRANGTYYSGPYNSYYAPRPYYGYPRGSYYGY
jgi:outer membrane lipoprotein SlyB